MLKDIIRTQIRKIGLVKSLEIENHKLEDSIYNLEKEILNLRNHVAYQTEYSKRLIEKFGTTPNFDHLKKSLKGNNGYLFLVNDSNSEIRQHYDTTFINNFNSSLFKKIINSRNEYCRDKNIKYFFFLVPDKSFICKDFLPFEIKIIKRNYDQINDLVPDFSDKLDPKCYWRTDSHINYIGGKEVTYNILNHIDNNFSKKEFEELINDQMTVNITRLPSRDLIMPETWSYSDVEKTEYLNEKTLFFDFKNIINKSVPEEFQLNRTTDYHTNEKGFKDLKILILRDSSTSYMKNFLLLYCKELLSYWNYWGLNKELIEWYEPDIILEIRTERLLENMEEEIDKRKLNNKQYHF